MADRDENRAVNTRRARGDAGAGPPEDLVHPDPSATSPQTAGPSQPTATEAEKKAGHPWGKIAAATLAAALLLTVTAIHYRVSTPPPPQQAAEEYMEEAYDHIAEEIGTILAAGLPLADEISAELIEAAANRTLPYKCTVASSWRTNGADCLIRMEITRPLNILLEMPVTVSLEDAQGPYGQKGARATAARLQRDRIKLEAPGLEGTINLQELGSATRQRWQEVLQGLRQMDPRDLEQWIPAQ